jgi:hypothetical protein
MTPTTAFTIDRKSFADSVGKVARSLPVRPPVPVLGGILAEVDALGVTLTVTDYEVLARTFATADVEHPGRFLVLGEHLARIARHLPGDTVRVECDGRNVTIASGQTRFTLLTMPTEDYPDMSEVGPDSTCRAVDMDSAKPATADGHERGLYAKRGLATVKMWRAPGRASRLYEPTDLQPGTWITWERHSVTRYYGPKGTMTHSSGLGGCGLAALGMGCCGRRALALAGLGVDPPSAFQPRARRADGDRVRGHQGGRLGGRLSLLTEKPPDDVRGLPHWNALTEQITEC